MNCRICGSTKTRVLGEVEYYSGFAWPIADCQECRCRFTRHDDKVYDYLHLNARTTYGTYREMAASCKKSFHNKDLARLKRDLLSIAKYRFVIESVEGLQRNDVRLLEVGCSRGYLTAYFILAGYDIAGSDVSAEALASAREAFGDCFFTAESPDLARKAPFDAIYHVGTIGCVGSPLEFTRRLLTMLKPGGRLLFNAPNADSCCLKDQLWIDASPPPDVVTLFRPGFWKRFFSDVTDVVEEIETEPPERSFAIVLRKLACRWRPPTAVALEESYSDFKGPRTRSKTLGDRLWNLVERGTIKLGKCTRSLGLTRRQPSPFGLFVTMTRR
jgi:SAM-dependent methyltransferase